MAYCHNTPANVSLLSGYLGIPDIVSEHWLACECQAVNNPSNPLNNEVNGHFATYSSAAVGLAASAWVIRNLIYYVKVRSAIAAGNAYQIARAIELSPWAAGHYGATASRNGCISRGIPVVVEPNPLTVFKSSLDLHQLHLWNTGELHLLIPTLDRHQKHLLHLYQVSK